jgi:hypothetical protein
MRKPGIPSAPKKGDDRSRFDGAVKESLETIMGRAGNRISALNPATATAEDCANKINEILDAMQ